MCAPFVYPRILGSLPVCRGGQFAGAGGRKWSGAAPVHCTEAGQLGSIREGDNGEGVCEEDQGDLSQTYRGCVRARRSTILFAQDTVLLWARASGR